MSHANRPGNFLQAPARLTLISAAIDLDRVLGAGT